MYKGASPLGGFVYEHKVTKERRVSPKPNANSLPGKLNEWQYIGREKEADAQ